MLSISFGGLVADDEETVVAKALKASSSAAITSQDSISNNLAIIMADSGASGHYFDDTIIRDVKYRLQVYVHLATRRKCIPAGGALLDGTEESVLQELVTDNYRNQFLVWIDIVAAPGIGCNLFSVMTEAKTNIGILFTYENSGLEGFDVTVPPRSKNSDLYSLVLDLSADGYSAKELKRNPVANAQMWHRRLGHLHA